MVLNELLTNVVKHAFGGRAGGRVDIAIATEGDAVEVRLSDNGRGGEISPRPGGLGMTIVHLLVERSLGGTVTFGSDQGTRVTIRFPRSDTAEDAAR
jgi:two-component sensor histidine kinase